jgi:hypothetical protein
MIENDVRNFISANFNIWSTLFWLHQRRELKRHRKLFDTAQSSLIGDGALSGGGVREVEILPRRFKSGGAKCLLPALVQIRRYHMSASSYKRTSLQLAIKGHLGGTKLNHQ